MRNEKETSLLKEWGGENKFTALSIKVSFGRRNLLPHKKKERMIPPSFHKEVTQCDYFLKSFQEVY